MNAQGNLAMTDENTKHALLEKAQRFFKEYYASCFWHWKPDLTITESMIPIVIKNLCTHGGRHGMLAAAELQEFKAGYEFDWLERRDFHHRAQIRHGVETLKMEWCQDSPFRFFPVQVDPEFSSSRFRNFY
jgi:hypothetical protein